MPEVLSRESPAVLLPRPGALREVRARAALLRRRRLVRATVAGAATVAVVVAMSAVRQHAWQSLEPTGPVPSVSPRPTGGPSAVATDAAGRLAHRPAVPAAPARPPVSVPEPTSIAFAPPLSSTPDDPPLMDLAALAVTKSVAPAGALACGSSAEWQLAPGGWCARRHRGADATAMWLGATFCRMSGEGEGTILLDRLPRVRVLAARTRTVVFDSEVRGWADHGDAVRGTVWTVEERECLSLLSPWDYLDNDGDTVVGGGYLWLWGPPDSAFGAWADGNAGGGVSYRGAG